MSATALEDLNVIVAGQGGDGSLTVITLLAGLLRDRGLNVYTERDVLSRIKGGHAAAVLRAFTGERYCIGDHIQLLVAFDEEAVRLKARYLDEASTVIYDDSGGPVPEGVLPRGVRVFAAPFARLAIRRLRRELFKNSIAFAVVGRLLGLTDQAMETAFRKRFARMGPRILAYNLEALQLGFELADELELTQEGALFAIAEHDGRQQLLITGNQAVGFGFLVGGGRFFAGYPITPSTDIMEWLERWLPRFGGVVKQTEDELAAINMALGAALTGTRAMVATSGPGLSLMQEGIGQAGAAEIPLVIVDCQRGGPSTGLPTKPEQSDLNVLVFGGHGEFPRIVLTPSHPEDCFYLSVEACNLAARYQCPVFLALDQGIAQNQATVAPFALERLRLDLGKLLDADRLAEMEVYQRYALTEDGISPWAPAGTPGGLSLVTGNEHDAFGQVTTHPEIRKAMMDKRLQKVARAALPPGREAGDPEARIGFLGIGMTYGVILEAMEQLAAQGLKSRFLAPRTLWPMQRQTLEFVAGCERVYVVEHNATAQLAGLLVYAGAPAEKLRHVLKYDGTPFRPGELVAAVRQEEEVLQ